MRTENPRHLNDLPQKSACTYEIFRSVSLTRPPLGWTTDDSGDSGTLGGRSINGIGERGPHPKQCNRRHAPASSLDLWAWVGPRYKSIPRRPSNTSVSPRSAQEKLPSHSMKFFVILFAIVAAASAGIITGHHEPSVHHVLNIQQAPAIPAPHPQPLNIKLPHSTVTKIHYTGPHISEPHLVGVEHYVPAPEPAISVIKTHGHGHGY
ncbi:hypothetical protein HN011_002587 [Eciton burchellii]|nr:hypothetical protein HN011_002587 [Eciton burchellii]